jgi:hypothetical protein
VKNERKPRSLLKTVKTEVTAKVDEVKTIEKALKEFRVEKEKQVDKRIEAESPVTLPPHFATTFNISILTFTIFIFTFNIFISIFNPFVADPPDHHFQIFTSGDVSDCKTPCLSLRTISAQMKPIVKALANSDSIRLFKVPESNLIHALETYTGTYLFQNTYSQVKPGNLKMIFTMTHSYFTT